MYVPRTCAERFHGQVIAEAVAVDASDDAVYWLDYNFGTLQRRSRGEGAIETIVTWPEEHLADSMRVSGGYAYWTSKALGGVYRVAVAGGSPERILESDRTLGQIEVIGEHVYAATYDGALLWWRSPSEHGVLEVGDDALVLAAGPDVLFVGSAHEIQRLASPGAGLQDELRTKAPVEALAVSMDGLYWKEGGRVMRRVRGEVSQITASAGYATLAAVPGGVLIGESNVISFAADELDGVVPVGIALAEITDLEVRGASVFVGTNQGSVHELCIDPTQAVALQEPESCPGSMCDWYASGALASRSVVGDSGIELYETFYADGTPSAVLEDPEHIRIFFVDGTADTGAPWSEP